MLYRLRGDQPNLADVSKFYPCISPHLIFGLSSAMYRMVAKSWLTRAASSERKVWIFSIYMVINKGFFGAGQLLLLLDDPSGDQ